MTARSSGFTLIELIVVVAIIGTLAAVGVTAYSGYTDSAKKQSAKTNHATIAKYIAAETTKCELEEDTVMDGNLDCDDLRVVNAVSTATGNALADFSNPFETDQEAIVEGPAQDCGEDTEGMTFVDNSVAGRITLTTCWDPGDATANPVELPQEMTNAFRVDGR